MPVEASCAGRPAGGPPDGVGEAGGVGGRGGEEALDKGIVDSSRCG
jgi:hypothetical protein